MILNHDKEIKYYEQIPRIGALELSLNGLLIFSKLKSHYWPNPEKLTFKAMQVCEDINNGIELDDYTKRGAHSKSALGMTQQQFSTIDNNEPPQLIKAKYGIYETSKRSTSPLR